MSELRDQKDSTTPTVSVVMATRNGQRHIAEQLAALASESVEGGFEVVVSDNGSTDRTAEIARSFADRLDISVVDSSDVTGIAHARNRGVANARGEAIVFLDDDDVIEGGYLEAMRVVLAEFPLAGARFEVEQLNDQWDEPVRDVVQTTDLTAEPFPFSYGAGLACRREAFDRLGGFDESFLQAGDDVDFCARAFKEGLGVGFAGDAVLHYRFREDARALFRQGRKYGYFGVVLDHKHPELVRTPPRGEWLRGLLRSLSLVVLSSTRSQRARGAFYLGRRLGHAEGRLRYLIREPK